MAAKERNSKACSKDLSLPKKKQAHKAWDELTRRKGKKSSVLIPLPEVGGCYGE